MDINGGIIDAEDSLINARNPYNYAGATIDCSDLLFENSDLWFSKGKVDCDGVLLKDSELTGGFVLDIDGENDNMVVGSVIKLEKDAGTIDLIGKSNVINNSNISLNRYYTVIRIDSTEDLVLSSSVINSSYYPTGSTGQALNLYGNNIFVEDSFLESSAHRETSGGSTGSIIRFIGENAEVVGSTVYTSAYCQYESCLSEMNFDLNNLKIVNSEINSFKVGGFADTDIEISNCDVVVNSSRIVSSTDETISANEFKVYDSVIGMSLESFNGNDKVYLYNTSVEVVPSESALVRKYWYLDLSVEEGAGMVLSNSEQMFVNDGRLVVLGSKIDSSGEDVLDQNLIVSKLGYTTHNEMFNIFDNMVKNVVLDKINYAPVLEEIDDVVVDEGDVVRVTAVASDSDDLEYIINDSRFEQYNNVFVWQTDEEGVYSFEITVSDGELSDSDEFSVTVSGCEPDWVFNYTSLEECGVNDSRNRVKYYYDVNECGLENPYDNVTENEECDYCVSEWTNVSGECQASDTFRVDFFFINTCCSETGLESDCDIPENETYPCDYCTPDWQIYYTEWSDCEIDDNRDRVRYYYDVNNCGEENPYDNVTESEQCDYESLHKPRINSIDYESEYDEKDEVRITVDASDPDNDELEYSINDSRFEQDNNVFTWQGVVGEYSVKVEVDDGEFSDSEVIDFVVNPLPDIELSGFEVARAYGKNVFFKFVLENVGNEVAENVYWKVDSSDGQEKTNDDPLTIEIGQEVIVYTLIKYSESGNYTAEVAVDFDNLIKELDESNNDGSVEVEVG